jgi:ABC-type multidrug transport system ATPase subunit
VLYEALTVRETLGYAARLRLPSHMSRADKLARAEDVIVALGCVGGRAGGRRAGARCRLPAASQSAPAS